MRPVSCAIEWHGGEGAGGELLQGALSSCAPGLLRDYAGQVQCIYMDPPYLTGQQFSLRQRVGEAGWRGEKSFLSLPTYLDRYEPSTYLAMMREALEVAHALLSESGTLFLHIDYRMHGFLRVLADEVFGGGNLMNEIIWTYQSGGRALRHFSRKHDTILFYRKGKKPYFDIRAVAVPRAENRSNHMRRQVDDQGRAFRTIRSGGREYRYYEDEPVYLSDVWSDISHLQQKDPERTGYDTQKPKKLLDRILRCASRPGDLVADLFFGSGTTLEVAAETGRRFLGVDAGPLAHATARKRLLPYAVRQALPPPEKGARLLAELDEMIGFYAVRLLSYAPPEGAWPALDAVDQWSAGLLDGQTFHAHAHAARSPKTPELPRTLEIPMLSGRPAILITDIFGRRQVYDLSPG